MLSVVRKIFDLLTGREKVGLVLLFVVQVIVAGLEMAGIASIMPFMAVVVSPDAIETNRWLNKAFHALEFSDPQKFLFFLGVLVLILIVFTNLSKALMLWLTLTYENTLNYKLARRLLASYLARPYRYFLDKNPSEMGKNILAEVRTVIAGVLSSGMIVLSSTLVSLAILALLTAVNPIIALNIVLVLGSCYGIIYLFVRRCLSRIGREQVEANALKYKAAGEALSGIKDLKILGREVVFIKKFAVAAKRHSHNNVTAGVISQLPRYALEILAFGGILMIVLNFLGNELGRTKMVPLLALYAFAGYRLLPALQQIFSGITQTRFNLAALDILHHDLVEQEGKSDAEKDLVRSREVDPMVFNHEIEFNNVTFRYSENYEPVLKGLSLTIPKNASIGFVGATGSGKTTAIDILLGLLQPSSGQVRVDGKTIEGANVPGWQRNLGYVPQAIFLCDDTVARNIAFGVPESEVNREAVMEAARIANLHDFVEQEMPNGYETIIGDRGIRLSGGQRQRIGIARALYHNPAVLIMDEATSALDGLTEEAVMDAIGNLSSKKTIVMIAHRLTTVRDCDMIYLLDHGHIVAQGNYADLQRSSEWFRAAARTGSVKTGY